MAALLSVCVSARVALWRVLVAIFCTFTIYGHSTADWPLLQFTPVVTNRFDSPTCIASANDATGRLFIGERSGKVWIIRSGQRFTTPSLDISSLVTTTEPEQGLLGLAFPADFSSKQCFYACYAAKTNATNHIVVSRFHMSFDPNVASSRSEEIILKLSKPDTYHNGGHLAFGPDGYLYVGVGDGGPHGDTFNRAQDLSSLFGKILRIDVEGGREPYSIPQSNPFAGQPNVRPEIWAYGLRNPWRFSFDRATGDLWIGDVGQGFFEEVDFQSAKSRGGENYGWRIKEGLSRFNVPPEFADFNTLTSPIFTYDHASMGGDGGQGSVTGGYAYRGPTEPRMDGLYIAGDFTTGTFWGIKQVGDQWATNRLQVEFPTGGMSAFGEDEEGNLLVATYWSGIVYRINDSRRVLPPIFTPPGPALYSTKVRVTTDTPQSAIHYTLNTAEPSLNDPVVPSDGLVTVSNGATLRARAFRSDLQPSDITTRTFTNRAAPPTFAPPSGINSRETNVTITCETPGAAIYYTTDLWAFPPTWTVYTNPIPIRGSLNIYAYAEATDYATSEQSVAYYWVRAVETPAFSIYQDWLWDYDGPVMGASVYLGTSTERATIYYTLDGSTPTTNSLVFREPILLDRDVTITAFATAPDYVDSTIVAQSYNPTRTGIPRLEPPHHYDATNVIISSVTPGATIHYTIGGATPTTSSPIYTGSIPIRTNGTVIRAIAVAPGLTVSREARGEYSLPDPQLIIDPSPYFDLLPPDTKVSLSTLTPGAVIHFTTDGKEATAHSPIYTGPIPIEGRTEISVYVQSPFSDPTWSTTLAFNVANWESTFVSTIAHINSPSAICADSTGNLYVAETVGNRIWKIATDGAMTALPGTFFHPTGVAVDAAGNVYVGEDGCVIQKIAPTGAVSEFARMDYNYCYDRDWLPLAIGPEQNVYGGFWYSVKRADGFGTFTNIMTGLWMGSIAPAVDLATNVYGAGGDSIFVARPNGSTELFAGYNEGYSDGPRLQSAFENITAAAARSAGEIAVVDGNFIRRIRNDSVTSVAGNWDPGYQNGPGSSARFSDPSGVCIAPDGSIYVADTGNNCVRKISFDSTGIGIPDEWQIRHFGMIGIDPNADADRDGVSNLFEFQQGTNPRSSRSRLSITRPMVDPEGRLHIRWTTAPNRNYQLQFSRDLSNWSNVGAQVAGDGSLVEITDPEIIDGRAHWFYRLVVMSP
jgi:hypothetical protein